MAAENQEGAKVMELLRQRLESNGSLEDVKVDTFCFGDKGVRSVLIFGSGVGIWNGGAQFNLDRNAVVSVLRRFVESKFGQLEEVYGGRDDPGDGAVRVICRAGLSIGGQSSYSSQLDKGRQSKELKALANAVLDLCQGPAQQGKTIASLNAGLAQLAAGKLAPETFTLQLHRRKELLSEEGLPGGWLLRLEGAKATAQKFVTGKGFVAPVSMTLSQDRLRSVASQLGELEVGSLPVNLFAEDYTDLTVAVLNRQNQIQARRFAGMTASTHGQKQERFNRLYELLSGLAEHVLAEGKQD